MIKHKLLSLFLTVSLLFIQACASQETDVDFQSEKIDSSKLYTFFEDKISSSWNFSEENDSVIFEFDAFGLPRKRSETFLIGTDLKQSSIEFRYNLSDSTETVRHLQQYGGGHFLTVIRKFNSKGKVAWKEEIDVHHNHTKTCYDESGMIISLSTMP